MKKILLILTILFTTVALHAQRSRTVLKNEVPKRVIENFYHEANIKPDVPCIWTYTLTNRNYAARFRNKGLNVWYNLLEDGTFVFSSQQILLKDIPGGIIKTLKKVAPDALVLIAHQITRDGSITYQVKVMIESNDEKVGYRSKTRNYIFDKDGELIRQF